MNAIRSSQLAIAIGIFVSGKARARTADNQDVEQRQRDQAQPAEGHQLIDAQARERCSIHIMTTMTP